MAYYLLEYPRKAIEYFQEVLQINPENKTARTHIEFIRDVCKNEPNPIKLPRSRVSSCKICNLSNIMRIQNGHRCLCYKGEMINAC